jgi:hypothetical protein
LLGKCSLAVAAVVLLGASVLTGCGSDSTTTVSAAGATGATGVSGTQSSSVRDRQRPSDAISVVKRYYALLNDGEYARAWSLVPPGVRAASGGYDRWKAGYDATLASSPQGLFVKSVSAHGRTVAIGLGLHAIDKDACTGAHVSQQFSGTWTFYAAGGDWVPTSIALHKVAGGTPALDASECGPSPQPHPSEQTSSTSCDPSYAGACLDPNSPDYDCEGGTGDGPDYVAGPIEVVGDDHFDLDSDGDGIACES